MSTPVISVIIPVYNQQHYLAVAIESVLAQTRTEFEVIVWDDGSSDHSLEIARAYAQQDARVQAIAASHCGLAPALQGAFARAQGKYLGWLDSDDWLAPTALQETSQVLQSYPQLGFVYTDYWVTDAAGRVLRLGQRCQRSYSPKRLLVDFMTFHFRLIRGSAFEQAGGIDPKFQAAPDYDLCLRLSEVASVGHWHRPLYYYRRHGNTMSYQRKLEQIHYSKRAVEAALKRRGLDQTHKLHVEFYRDQSQQWQSRFHLRLLDSQKPSNQ